MAIVASTLFDSTGVGNPDDTRVWRENVARTLADISPWETPILNMLAAEDTTDPQPRWLVKKLNPIKATLDTIAEGAEFGASGVPGTIANSGVQPQRRPILTSSCETFVLPVIVADSTRRVEMFGDNDEFYLRIAEAVKENGRNSEIRIFDDTFAVAANTGFTGVADSTTLRMKPLMQQIFQARGTSGLNFAPTIGSGVNAFRSADMARVDRPSGSLETESAVLDTTTAYPIWAQTKWTETMATKFQEIMRGNKDTGGVNIDTFVVPPANWGQTGAFGIGPGVGSAYGDLTINLDAQMKTIVRCVHVYKSNFGYVQVVESRWLDQAKNTGAATTMVPGSGPRDTARNCGLIWGFERKFLKLYWHQRPEVVKMAKTGLNEKAVVHHQMTVALMHPQAAGVIIGVNNV